MRGDDSNVFVDHDPLQDEADIEARKERAKRLRRSRINGGYKTIRAFAIAVDVPERTYRAHEMGARGMKWSTAERYALLLGVDPVWLWAGTKRVARGGETAVLRWSELVHRGGAVVSGEVMTPMPEGMVALRIPDGVQGELAGGEGWIGIDRRDRELVAGHHYVAVLGGQPTVVSCQRVAGRVVAQIGYGANSRTVALTDVEALAVIGRIIRLIRVF